MLFRSLVTSLAIALSVAAAPADLTNLRPSESPAAGAIETRQVSTGEGTYYDPGLGACGYTNTGSELIIAVARSLFDTYPGYVGTNPNNNPICGKRIRAFYGEKSVDVTIVDRCYGCAYTDLDFSPAAFAALAPLEVGRLFGMTWQYI